MLVYQRVTGGQLNTTGHLSRLHLSRGDEFKDLNKFVGITLTTQSGWWCTYPSEKWWSSWVEMMKFPTEWKVIKAMFQTTNQIISITIWKKKLNMICGFVWNLGDTPKIIQLKWQKSWENHRTWRIPPSSSDKPMTKDTTEQVFSGDFTNCSKFWGKNEEHQQICCHKNSDTTCYHNHNSNFTCWISQFFMGCIIPLVASFSMDLGKL